MTSNAATSPIVEAMARLGYGVRGLIYFIIGLLAVELALGVGGTTADQQGAIAVIGRQPEGRILLWVILAGLACYALWGLIRALLDPLHKGHDLKGIATRCGFLFSAVSYAILIMPTYASIAGGAQSAHNGAQTAQTQQYFSKILALPWGRWAAVIVGLMVIAVGLYQMYEGFRLHYDRQVQPRSLNQQQAEWVTRLGKFGTIARGIVFAILGIFLLIAAFDANPSQAKGIDGALMSLLHKPYGTWLMGIIALGLIAFGIYSFFTALWFRLSR